MRALHDVNVATCVALALVISTMGVACRPAATPEENTSHACAGVPEDSARQGLFPYRDAIERVEPLKVEISGAPS